MTPLASAIGAYILSAAGLGPADNAAGSRNGSAVDASEFASLVIVANTAAASGSPTSFSVAYALESSVTGGGGWAAVTDVDGDAVVLTAAAAGVTELDVDLQYVTSGHPYLRLVETVAFVGGTSPKVISGATLTLGGARRLPV